MVSYVYSDSYSEADAEALSDGYHIVAYVSAYMSEKLRLQQFTDLSSLKEQNFEYSASNLKT